MLLARDSLDAPKTAGAATPPPRLRHVVAELHPLLKVTHVADTAPSVAALGQIRSAAAADLRLAPGNPRVISPRAIEIVALSLKKFGWQQPIVIDSHNEVVAGHTRLLAARSLGLKQVPVTVADKLTDVELEAFRIADNRTHDFTTWDLPMLVDQLDHLSSEFSDVLALADWEGMVADCDDEIKSSLKDDLDLADLGLSDSVNAKLTGGFTLSVCFETKEQAVAAEEGLLEIPGVFDVRHAN